MRYVSTRGGAHPARFSEILLDGLAPDGGLYVPERIPQLNVPSLRGLSYPELAFRILSEFIDDLPDLRRLVFAAYRSESFPDAEVVPLRTLEPGLHLLGLSQGPTLAFKDIALQLLGHLFENVLQKEKKHLNILGATSGDTGSAAEYAMRGRPGIRVFMLSPHGRMSEFQRAQMFSLQEPNIHNLAVKGVFDDCQDLVKQVNADAEFKRRYAIGAVNSINWARIAAQVVYYFKGYYAATRSDEEQVSFAVPSGNFGNIYAGYVALRMGLPVKRLILATNENNVLDEFFRTGRYRVRREVVETSSPSMDISKASNFERYAWHLTSADTVRELWRQLDARGEFTLAPGKEFASGTSTHADRIATIRWAYSQYGVMVDPHTADGIKVGLEKAPPGEPLICLETALPAKFAPTIREALARDPARPEGLANLESLPQRFELIERDAEMVKTKIRGFAAQDSARQSGDAG
jgi:threonine synthase